MKLPNLILIGPMGSGKSSVGKRLAHTFGRELIDSDKEIEQATGATISLIFELEGEAGFRKRETQALRQLLTRENIILATGGGAILTQENRELLRAHGKIIFLRASIDQILQRTRFDTSRPLLRSENPRDALEVIMQIRQPLYESIADLVVDTDNLSVSEVSHEIQTRLKR